MLSYVSSFENKYGLDVEKRADNQRKEGGKENVLIMYREVLGEIGCGRGGNFGGKISKQNKTMFSSCNAQIFV